MAFVIREMCPSDRQEVGALLSASGGGDSAQQSDPPPAEKILQEGSGLGLVACENGKIVAVIVCDQEGLCGYLHLLPEAQAQRDNNITKALVDKTMLKLNARGVGKFRIDMPQSDLQHPLWDEVKWGDAGSLDSSDETDETTSATDEATQAVAEAEATQAIEEITQTAVEPALETGPVTQAQ